MAVLFSSLRTFLAQMFERGSDATKHRSLRAIRRNVALHQLAALEVLETRTLLAQTPSQLAVAEVAANPGHYKMTWTADPQASVHEVWIRRMDTAPFQDIVLRDVQTTVSGQTTAFDLPETLVPGNYRFWVRSFVVSGTTTTASLWSPLKDFVVSGTKPSMVRIGTAQVAQNPIAVVSPTSYEWSAVPGADYYQLWLSKQDAQGTLQPFYTGADLQIRSNTFVLPLTSPATNLPSGKYRVFVGAVRSSNPGAISWSAGVDFDVTQSIANPPAWVSTSSGLGNGDRLRWTPVDGAARYEIWLSQLTGVPTAQRIDATADIVGTEYTTGTLLQAADYRVWVRGIDALGVLSPWSLPLNFTVSDIPASPGVSRSGTYIIEPDSVTTSGNITSTSRIAWNAVQWADTYHLLVYNSSNTTVVDVTQITNNFYDLPQSLTSGTYRIWVQAIAKNSNVSPYANSAQLSVASDRPVFNGVSGNFNAASGPLTWSSSGGSEKYQLKITDSSNGDSILTQVVLENSFDVARYLSAGTPYQAKVQAFDSSTLDPPTATAKWSDPFNFTIAGESLSFLGIAGSGAVSQTPLLTWTPSVSATSYDLQVFLKSATGTIGVTPTLSYSNVQNSSFRLEQSLKWNSNYQVRVRPVYGNGVSGAWKTIDVKATASEILSPIGVAVGPTPMFRWQATEDATQYKIYITNAATNLPVGTGTYDVTGGKTNWVWPGSLPAGDYRVQVRPFGAGWVLKGDWSAIATFSVAASPLSINLTILEPRNTLNVGWVDSAQTQNSKYGIRLVPADQAESVVYEGRSSALTHSISATIVAGVYRADVGRLDGSGVVAWNEGPYLTFDGSAFHQIDAPSTAPTAGTLDRSGPFIGDFNGDNVDDIVTNIAAANSTTGSLKLEFNQGSQLDTSMPPITWSGLSTTAPILVGDFNGDGRDDLINPDPSQNYWRVMQSNGAGFNSLNMDVGSTFNPDIPTLRWYSTSNLVQWNRVVTGATYDVRVYEQNAAGTLVFSTTTGDFSDPTYLPYLTMASLANNKEYTMFIRTRIPANGLVPARVTQWSDGFNFTKGDVAPGQWQSFVVGDFNGDRRDDVAMWNKRSGELVVSISNGTSFERTVWADWSGSNDLKFFTVLDLNGDGRKDIIARNDSTSGSTKNWQAAISTGTSFVTQTWTPGGNVGWLSSITAAPQVGDANGDGRQDLFGLVGSVGNQNFQVALSGSGNFMDLNWTASASMPITARPIDVNHDGRTDLVGFNGNESRVALANANGTGFLPMTVWKLEDAASTPWFTKLPRGTTYVVDYDYRYREAMTILEDVRNTVDFEPYNGLKKGAASTRGTKSGNAWDQANLAASELTGITSVRTQSGVVSFGESEFGLVNNWLNVTSIIAARDLLQLAGLSSNLTSQSPKSLAFNHAWTEVLLPGASGLKWTAFDPSWKQYASVSVAAITDTIDVSTQDLQQYFSPQWSFTADFDDDGTVPGKTDHDGSTLPTEVTVLQGSLRPLVIAQWPTLSNGNPDVKLATAPGTITAVAVGQDAVSGTLKLDIYSELDPVSQSDLNTFRVFARSTRDYEIGVEHSSTVTRIYERNASGISYPTDGLTETPIVGRTFSGLQYITAVHVEFSVNGRNVVAIVGNTKYEFTPTSNSNSIELRQGAFGFATAGPYSQFIDKIDAALTDVQTGLLSDHLLQNAVRNGEASASKAVDVRTVIYSDLPVVIPYSVVSTNTNTTVSSAYRVRFVLSNGSNTNQTQILSVPDIALQQITVQMDNSTTAGLWIDGSNKFNVTRSTTIPTTLTVQHFLPFSDSISSSQIFTLPTDGLVTVTLNAEQYTDLDSMEILKSLNTKYAAAPADLTTVNANERRAISEITQQYAAIRYLAESRTLRATSSRLFDTRIIGKGVTAGIVSSSTSLVTSTATAFLLRPTRLIFDQPMLSVAYFFGGPPIAAAGALKNLGTVLVTDLSALESQILSEITTADSISAVTYLSTSKALDVPIMRLSKRSEGVFQDEFSTFAAAYPSGLETLLMDYPPSIRAEIASKIAGGSTVTIPFHPVSIAGFPKGAYLLEDMGAATPELKSVLFDTVGNPIHGGLGQDLSTAVPFLARPEVENDLYSGRVSQSYTDFVVKAPGFEIPFTRTWTTPLASDPMLNLSFGRGWSTVFDQYLELNTFPSIITGVSRRSYQDAYGQNYLQTSGTLINASLWGLAADILWHREDGGSVGFGRTTLAINEYSNWLDAPGANFVRTTFNEPVSANTYNAYELRFPDGKKMTFVDFTTPYIGSSSLVYSGYSTAVLTAIKDRFGNELLIDRVLTSPYQITRVKYKNGSTERVLLDYGYVSGRLNSIALKPSSPFFSDRVWTYSYQNNEGTPLLWKVDAPETLSQDGTTKTNEYTYARKERISVTAASAFLLKTSFSAEIGTTIYEYYANGKLRSSVDATGAKSFWRYDQFAHQTAAFDTQGRRTLYNFSAFGEMRERIADNGERTVYTTAENIRRVSKEQYSSGRGTTTLFNLFGQILEFIPESGVRVRYTYGVLGSATFNQLVSVTEDPDGVVGNADDRILLTNTYLDPSQKFLQYSKNGTNDKTEFGFNQNNGLLQFIVSPMGFAPSSDSVAQRLKYRTDYSTYDAFGNNTFQSIGNQVSRSSVTDEFGQWQSITDETNRSTDYIYDSLSRIKLLIELDPYDSTKTRQTTFTYGPNGKLAKNTLPDSTVYQYEYDKVGRLIREIMPDGTFTETVYNLDGTVSAQIDANRNTTRFVYDKLRRLVQTIFADGSSAAVVYDQRGDLVKEIDPRGNVTSHAYYPNGQLLSTTDAEQHQTSYKYDDYGNLNEITDEKGVTTLHYDAMHRLIERIYSDPLITFTNKNLRIERFFYDKNGNLERTEVGDLSGGIAIPANIMTSTVLGADRKRIESTVYDNRDRPSEVFDAAGVGTKYTYDDAGRLKGEYGKRGYTASANYNSEYLTEYQYDKAGWLQFVIEPIATSDSADVHPKTEYKRDSLGRAIEVIDANGNSTRSFYDSLGRLTATQDALGFVTRVTYDPAGNVVESIDQSGLSTFTRYDDRNRAIAIVEPAVVSDDKIILPTETLEYDAAGNVIAVTDAIGNASANPKTAGRTTSFKYDGMNRLIEQTGPKVATWIANVSQELPPIQTWKYDAHGNIIEMTDALLRKTVYEYNMFGNTTKEILPDPDQGGPLVNTTTQFRYDAFGNLLKKLEWGNASNSVTVDDRATVYTYDSLNQLKTTVLPDPDGTATVYVSPVVSFDYDAAGNLRFSTDAKAVTTEYVYDRLNRLIETKTPDPDPTVLSTSPITRSTQKYDLVGNLISQTIFNANANGNATPETRTTTYAYDPLNRVSVLTTPDPDGFDFSSLTPLTTRYEYDAVGNVMRELDNLGRVIYRQYDALNRLVAEISPDPDLADGNSAPKTSYAYDPVGNLTSTIDPLNRKTKYSYDALNRLTITTVPDPYTNDAEGAPEYETRYDFVGNMVAQIDPRENATTYEYNGWNLVTKMIQPDADGAGSPVTTFGYDQLGRQTLIVDARTGQTQTDFDYLDRVTKITYPQPATGLARPTVSYGYDANSNQTTAIDPLYHVTTRKFDRLNRVYQTEIAESLGSSNKISTSLKYDFVGNVIESKDANNGVTAYFYDKYNRLTQETLPDPLTKFATGPKTKYQYDTAGNQVSMADALGRVTVYTYDRLDRLLSETQPDPDGVNRGVPAPSLTYLRDSVGNIITTTDQIGRSTLFQYDGLNRLQQQTLPDPDGSGPLTSPQMSWHYDAAGNLDRITDALGNTTIYSFDSLNRLKSETMPFVSRLGSAKTTYVYDKSGNLTSVTDAMGRTTAYEYDRLNRQTKVIQPDPDGIFVSAALGSAQAPTLTTTYDAAGNVKTQTDHLSRLTSYDYDFLNRLWHTNLPKPDTSSAVPTITNFYDDVGNLTVVTDANEHTTNYKYDFLNRLTEIRLPSIDGVGSTGPMTVNTYDLVGNLKTVKDPLDRITQYKYDALNRLSVTESPVQDDGKRATTEYSYDAAGNLAQEKSLLTIGVYAVTSHRYDLLDREVVTIDAIGGKTQYSYDANNNVLAVIDPVGNATTYQYDSLNRLVAESSPIIGTPQDALIYGNRRMTQYEYDLVGSLQAVTDRRGLRTEFEYDRLDRVTNERWLNGTTTTVQFIGEVRYRYDNAGRLFSETEIKKYNNPQTGWEDITIATQSYTYDDLDRKKTAATIGTPGLQGLNFTYVYDLHGNLKSTNQTIATGLYSGNVAITWDYDGLDRPTVGRQSGGRVVAKSVKLDYLADSSYDTITRYLHPGTTPWTPTDTIRVVQTKFIPDAAGRLKSLTHSDGSALVGYTYGYDVADRVKSEIRSSSSADTQSYNYDNTNQLTTANRTSTAGVDESYAYDKNGNRITQTIVGANNQVTEDATYKYEYDTNGNRTRRTLKSDVKQYSVYTWDHRNRLTEVKNYKNVSGVSTLTQTVVYTYNNDGMRISKVVTGENAKNEYYLYDGDQLAAVMNASGQVLDQFFYGLELDQIFADETLTNGILWPLEDRTGTIQDVVSAPVTGTTVLPTTIVDHRTIDSYGNIVAQSNSAAADYDFFFSGLQWDAEAGLYFNRARWYDPKAGEFVGEDPLGFAAGDANLTRYAMNSPTKLKDNSGLQSENFGYGSSDLQISPEFQNSINDILRGSDRYSNTVASQLNTQFNRSNSAPESTFFAGFGGFFSGLGQGFVNIGTGLKETAFEISGSVVDTVGISRELLGGPRYEGYYSQTGEALQSGDVTMGQVYGNTFANGFTGGVYGHVETTWQYYNGEITADEASKRYGTGGVMQLAAVPGLRGTKLGTLRISPRGAVQSARSALRNLPSQARALPSNTRSLVQALPSKAKSLTSSARSTVSDTAKSIIDNPRSLLPRRVGTRKALRGIANESKAIVNDLKNVGQELSDLARRGQSSTAAGSGSAATSSLASRSVFDVPMSSEVESTLNSILRERHPSPNSEMPFQFTEGGWRAMDLDAGLRSDASLTISTLENELFGNGSGWQPGSAADWHVSKINSNSVTPFGSNSRQISFDQFHELQFQDIILADVTPAHVLNETRFITGNSISNVGSRVTASSVKFLDDFTPGPTQAFSGVFDPPSGHFLMRPSEGTVLRSGRKPNVYVRRTGGHIQVQNALETIVDVDRTQSVGFTAFLTSSDEISVAFKSIGVNRKFGLNDFAPETAHQAVLDAIQQATGKRVRSLGDATKP